MPETGNMWLDIQQIMPIVVICLVACLVLLGDLAWGRWKWVTPSVSLAGVIVTLIITIDRLGGVGDGKRFTDGTTAFGGGVAADTLFGASSVALLVTALLSILLAWSYLQSRGIDHGEYYVLLLFSVAGAMLMAAAQDLIVLFLGLEVLSFALYVMAGFARTDEKSEESSIKYFLLGAFASAFLLYGIALLYGATQSTNLDAITAVLKAGAVSSPMLLAGIAMLLVGLAFKAALVPFHQWTPDVYEGAPTSVTAYMAGAAKIGAFAAIIRVFTALLPVHVAWLPAITVLAILTMVFGNLLAIQQTNIKRMLAYSSIAHAGYLLVAVASMAHRDSAGADGMLAFNQAISGAMFYLFAYVFMTLGAFGVLIYLSGREKDVQQLSDLRGLARRQPLAAYTMLFFMLSLGGIPPTMGFMGKWQIFLAALQAGEVALAIVMALASVLAIYYYLKIVWMMCFDEPRDPISVAAPNRSGAFASIAISALATVLFGLAPYAINILTQVWQQVR